MEPREPRYPWPTVKATTAPMATPGQKLTLDGFRRELGVARGSVVKPPGEFRR